MLNPLWLPRMFTFHILNPLLKILALPQFWPEDNFVFFLQCTKFPFTNSAMQLCSHSYELLEWMLMLIIIRNSYITSHDKSISNLALEYNPFHVQKREKYLWI